MVLKRLKKIMVTGGAGYVGSHTAAALAEAGYEPVIVDNFLNTRRSHIDRLGRLIGRTIRSYDVDCTDQPLLEKVFLKEKDITGVIHFAALKSVRESIVEPLAYYRNNIGALSATVGAQMKYHVPYMIFSSSCTVYGDPKRLPVREDDLFGRAQSPYGFTKQTGERILQDVCANRSNMQAIALRYFNPIGAHTSGLLGEDSLSLYQNFVPLVMRSILDRKDKVTILGDDYPTKDGTSIRDYIHVMDVARAHVSALQYLSGGKQTIAFEGFNIGLGRGYSLFEIVRMIEQITRNKVSFKVGKRAPGDIGSIYADVRKARRVLGFKAQYRIEEAIAHAWQWQQYLKSKGRTSC